MAQEFTPDRDRAEEAAIRRVLESHALVQVDVEVGWAHVVKRLPLTRPSEPHVPHVLPRHTRVGARRSLRVAAVLVAATCALGLMLAGAGFVRERTMALDPGMQRIADEHLYQLIGQSRQADGITTTVSAAYLDQGRTVIYYTLALSPAQRAKYMRADLGSWTLTDQAGAEPTGGLGTCEAWPSDGSPIHCYLLQGPLPQAASTQTVSLRFEVTQIHLLTTLGQQGVAAGPWRFAFAVPYHQTNIGSVAQFFPHLLHLIPGQQP